MRHFLSLSLCLIVVGCGPAPERHHRRKPLPHRDDERQEDVSPLSNYQPSAELVRRIRAAFPDTPSGREDCQNHGALYYVLAEAIQAGRYDYDEGIMLDYQAIGKIMGLVSNNEKFIAIAAEKFDSLCKVNDTLTPAKKKLWIDTLFEMASACLTAAGGGTPMEVAPRVPTKQEAMSEPGAARGPPQAVQGGEQQFQGRIGDWLPEKEDKAFLRAQKPVAFMAGPRPRNDVDPRTFGLTVWDQGQVGSCAGHARASAIEEENYFRNEVHVAISRMFCYLTAQMVDGSLGSDCGSTISGNMKAGEKYGVCKESECPYPGRYVTKLPDSCWAAAKSHKILKYADCRSYEKTRDFVGYRIGPVQIGIGWSGVVFGTGDEKNTIVDYSPGRGGGHSVLVAGVLWKSKVDEEGNPYLVILNSWGARFGDKGFCLCTPRAYRKMMVDSFCEALGISSLELFHLEKLDPRSFGNAMDCDAVRAICGLRKADPACRVGALLPQSACSRPRRVGDELSRQRTWQRQSVVERTRASLCA